MKKEIMNFIAIVGTNASFSYNRKLLWYMKKHFKAEASIEIHEIADIPLFSEDIHETPMRVREIARAIGEADGVIFATPEYDHSITASLKSLIEWLSWGDLHPLTNTPIMIVGVSLGNMGTVFAQENLRQILSSPGLDAFVLPANQFLLGRAAQSFDENDALVDERTIGWLEHCFHNFADYTLTLRSLRHTGEDRTSSAAKVEIAEPSLLEKGEGWAIEDVSLLPETDAATGSSQSGAVATTTGNAEKIAPAAGVAVIEDGDGWWVEIVDLSDASTGASNRIESKVASGHGQPDTSTGASQH